MVGVGCAKVVYILLATKEALWLKSLAKTVNINVNNVLIYEDNNGCIAIANNASSYKLAKHIDIKYHYSREQIEKGNIRLKHVVTEKQIAKLTKSLGPVKFLRIRTEMGLE